ncbi:E3 ubiquitin-protein ligase SGR9, amyloplastic-like [Magnolia sinica]|uniref:E3 ubiquitin-protein ligase SGR9, amyloplastic-like n=1 Tax=Magnolia sinica TaxID=86752 RepID=UPI0026593273|nr:E3 ubiquitin-protein ligase SGR9, amyloplastic-like [Magnolia sinica]
MEEEKWGEAVMGTLVSLDVRQFSHLTNSLASDSLHKQRRLCYLLKSPHHFTQTVRYIESLSFHQKALLLARLLLRSLVQITLVPSSSNTDATKNQNVDSGSRDLDAALLLFALCEASDLDSTDWHTSLTDHFLKNVLSLAGLGVSGWAILGPCVDTAVKCRQFLEAVTGQNKSAGSVTWVEEYDGNGTSKECVICWEELESEKRDGCKLPCEHVFHWFCILPWLRKANTCPCCRFELLTTATGDDVFCEIERLWRIVIARSRRNWQSGYHD